MITGETCQQCGSALDETTTGSGLCAVCLMRSGLVTESEGEPAGFGRLVLPHRFGPYELVEEIGRGGMGVVYAAWQPALKRKVAVKLMLSGAYASESALERFRSEAAAAACLQHRNIVEIHECGEWEGQPYYVMGLVSGQNLAQLCNSRPMDAGRAAKILRDLAGAVQYAHQSGILHRDLKPSNVLMDERDCPRITDFGLARRLDEDVGVTQTGQIMGTPGYASPEQAGGRAAEVDARSDVYGLGAILYHLLTGRAPFNAATPTETLCLVLDSDPLPPRALNPATPGDLETICLKCLAKVPARRYATAAEVADDLERHLDHRPIRARPPSVFYRMRKFARRYRTIVAATGMVFIALVTGLVLAVISQREAEKQRQLAEETTRIADTAREQAESQLAFMLRDLEPELTRYGRLSDMRKAAEDVVGYFTKLPPELRSDATDRAHAEALEALADICGSPPGSEFYHTNIDAAVGAKAAQEALTLRTRLADRHREDPDARVALIDATVRASSNDPQRTHAEWDALLQWTIKEYRALEHEYPKHRGISLGLAWALAARAYYANHVGDPGEAVEAGLEARARFEQIMGAGPVDARVRANYAKALSGLATAYNESGDQARCLEVSEEAVAFAEDSLEKDPGNIQLLSVAAMNRWYHARKIAPVSARQARDSELIARARILRLIELDPENPRWRENHAVTHEMEMRYLLLDGQNEQARAILLKRVEEYESPSDDPTHRIMSIGPLISLARIAADMGDVSAARAHMQKAGELHQLLQETSKDFPEARAGRELFWTQDQTLLLLRLQDWTGLLAQARRLSDAVDQALVDKPGEPWLLSRKATACYFLGVATLRTGRPAEAIPMLQQALEVVPPSEMNAAQTRDYLIEALIEAGDPSTARRELEKNLEFRERNLAREPELWQWRTEFARTAWLFARVLDSSDPNDAARRQSLLDRAAATLTGSDADARMTPQVRDLKGKIEALRAKFRH